MLGGEGFPACAQVRLRGGYRLESLLQGRIAEEVLILSVDLELKNKLNESTQIAGRGVKIAYKTKKKVHILLMGLSYYLRIRSDMA